MDNAALLTSTVNSSYALFNAHGVPRQVIINNRITELIVKSLRAGATEINVRGEYPGKYYLVPYNGKLKKFTDKKTIPQFIPQIWFGNEKLVAVSVILEDHIIFIEKNTFKMYQKGLCASDSVELVMRPNIRE